GATPLKAPLTVAYAPCTAPNNTHGAPLAYGSCAPPQQTSSFLTVGTPDANGQGAKSIGSVSMRASGADVLYGVSITDVRNKSDLSDYTGQLQLDATLRITDKNSGPNPDGPGPATVTDTHFPVTVPCAATSDTTVGSTCSISTSANAIEPST